MATSLWSSPSFFFSSRRRHTRFDCDWSSDVCSSDLRHAPRLHRLAPRQGVLAFHSGIARNALLAHARGAPIHRLLVRTLLHALLVPPAPVLVDQHDPVLRPLVDGLPGTRCQAPRIRAVVTDPLQVEEERLVLR